MLEKTALDQILRRAKVGALRVTYWDGDTRDYGDGSEPMVHITIHDQKLVRAMSRNVSLAIGEAYMDGSLEVDGPLEELIRFGALNDQALGVDTTNRAFKLFNQNNKKTQPKLISYHYDLGNDFYEMWLDRETMGYTCSYYKTDSDTLEQGQVQKFDHVLNKLRLESHHELLDIGFGWGYLLIRAAKLFGVRGTGVSLSREQHAYAEAWAKREGVADLVEFKLMNYQDLGTLGKQFDRIISVGFFEHVGLGNQTAYFEIINKLLKPDGISVLHTISQQTENPNDAFIDKYIFPGASIPGIPQVFGQLSQHGFLVKDYENIGPHYIPTLQEWWKRFEAHKEEVIAKYDESFYRMWRMYYAFSIAGFIVGSLSLSQWTFARVPGLDWPLTRDYLYRD